MDHGVCGLGIPPLSRWWNGTSGGGAQDRAKASGIGITVVIIRLLFACAAVLGYIQR